MQITIFEKYRLGSVFTLQDGTYMIDVLPDSSKHPTCFITDDFNLLIPIESHERKSKLVNDIIKDDSSYRRYISSGEFVSSALIKAIYNEIYTKYNISQEFWLYNVIGIDGEVMSKAKTIFIRFNILGFNYFAMVTNWDEKEYHFSYMSLKECS